MIKEMLLWVYNAVTSKGVFNDQEKSFIFYNPFSKGKMKSLRCKMELEAALSAWVFLNLTLWNGGRSTYLAGKPISEHWVASDVSDWMPELLCSFKDLRCAVQNQVGPQMAALPPTTLPNPDVGLPWLCEAVSEAWIQSCCAQTAGCYCTLHCWTTLIVMGYKKILQIHISLIWVHFTKIHWLLGLAVRSGRELCPKVITCFWTNPIKRYFF